MTASILCLWSWELVIVTYKVWNKTPESIFSDLHETSDLLSKYVMGVWSDNFTAPFFVSFIMTVFVPDIEGIQNKIYVWTGTTCSVNAASTCSANLSDISRRKSSRKAPNLK